MNRKQRGEKLRQIITQVREREFPYQERPKPKRDWTLYDLAQRSEIPDMLLLIGKLVDVAAMRVGVEKEWENSEPGRPRIPVSDVTKALLAQSSFGVSNRRAEGVMRALSGPLGIRAEFSYKTIERGYDPGRTKRILDEVFRLTNEPVRYIESVFGIDGTGQPTSVKQNYAADRTRDRSGKSAPTDDRWPPSSDPKKRGYVYGVGVIGTVTKMYAAWKSNVDPSKGELRFFSDLIRQTVENRSSVTMMTGDGIYGIRQFCQECANLGIIPRALPRRNVTLKRKGVDSWVKMLAALIDNPQQWLEDYHQRSITETGNSMMLAYNPGPLRKRHDPRKELESELRPIVHNIRRLCALAYLINLKIRFLSTVKEENGETTKQEIQTDESMNTTEHETAPAFVGACTEVP